MPELISPDGEKVVKMPIKSPLLCYNEQADKVYHHPTGSNQNTIHVGGEQQMTEQQFTTEELNNEIWREVAGSNGTYSVSTIGRVRRNTPGNGTQAGRIFKIATLCRGYPIVGLHIDGKHVVFTVHRLIAAAFLGDRAEGQQVNHVDGVKTNNRIENLEYCSQRENITHATRLGLNPSGDRNGSRTKPERLPRGQRHGSKTHPEKFAKGRKRRLHGEAHEAFDQISTLRKSGLTYREIGKIVGFSQEYVGVLLRGKNKSLVNLTAEK